jgi:hypothetical protein
MMGDAAGILWFDWVICPNHKKKPQEPQTFFIDNTPSKRLPIQQKITDICL